MINSQPKRTCAVCNIEVKGDLGRIVDNKGNEQWFCEGHSGDLFNWLSVQRDEDKFERNDKSPYVIIPLVCIVIAFIIGYRLMYPAESFYLKIGLFFISILYIVAFCSPSIYPRVLRIGYLRTFSLQSDRKLTFGDIMQIDATVIVGSLIFLTLTGINEEEQLLPSTTLSHLLGVNPQEMLSLITATIVAIFAFSAIATCIVNDIEVGRRIMVGGFVYLFFTIFLVAL